MSSIDSGIVGSSLIGLHLKTMRSEMSCLMRVSDGIPFLSIIISFQPVSKLFGGQGFGMFLGNKGCESPAVCVFAVSLGW